MKAINNKNRVVPTEITETNPKGAGPKRGRKKKIPDDDMVRRTVMGLAKRGHKIDEIADIVGVSRAWLTREYGHEIKNGREIADALVVENLYQQALKDTPSSINAGIYLTRARMGWKDKPDAAEFVRPSVVFNFGDLSYEERIHLMNRVKTKIGGTQIIEGEVYEDTSDE